MPEHAVAVADLVAVCLRERSGRWSPCDGNLSVGGCSGQSASESARVGQAATASRTSGSSSSSGSGPEDDEDAVVADLEDVGRERLAAARAHAAVAVDLDPASPGTRQPGRQVLDAR